MAQRVKCLPAMRETWVRSLDQEDPLEKEMATHSSILPGKSHGQRNLVGYSPKSLKESDMTERLHFPFHFSNTKPIFGNQLHFYTLIMKQLKK